MKRNKHSLSNYKLLTADMGKLIPVGLTEVLPGDTFDHSTSALIRVTPQLHPVMHPVTVRFHHWYVPMRIIMPDWEDFITGGPDGASTAEIPTFTTGSATANTQFDYFGVPPVENIVVSQLPMRAYNKIYNEFYRDQDLVTPVAENNGNILDCAWEKDYFTTARPWTQKGPEVTLPIAGKAPVLGIGNQDTNGAGPLNKTINQSDGSQKEFVRGWDTSNTDQVFIEEGDLEDYPDIYADLGQAEQVTINEFREAFALQRYQEARARYGSRYTEYLRYLGVKSSDARLQRPEYLGGGKQTISFSEVLQTVNQSQEEPIGRLAGHGIAAVKTNKYRRFFEEHGYVITIMSVRPKTVYGNGVPKTFLKANKEDFWQKELESIGQQEVTNNEVYADAVSGENVFGYQDRYAEYKRQWSTIAGEFRNTLDSWHMARLFSEAPALNQSFVECDPTKRVFADQTNHSLWCMVHHNIRARRLVKRGSGSSVR